MEDPDDGIVRAKYRFECKYCHKQFEWKSTMVSHLRIHTGEKPHTCQKCGKKFSHKSNYQKHLLMHKKKEWNVCKLCGECFQTPNMLSIHTKNVHHDHRAYQCDVCSRKFKHYLDYKNHLESHSHVGGYRCTHCDKFFETQQLLDSHKWQLIRLNLNSDKEKTEASTTFTEMSHTSTNVFGKDSTEQSLLSEKGSLEQEEDTKSFSNPVSESTQSSQLSPTSIITSTPVSLSSMNQTVKTASVNSGLPEIISTYHGRLFEIQNNSAKIQDIPAKGQDNFTKIQDNSAKTQDNPAKIQDNSAKIQDNYSTTQDNPAKIQDNSAEFQDNSAKIVITRKQMDKFEEWTKILQTYYVSKFVNPRESYGKCIRFKESECTVDPHQVLATTTAFEERNGSVDL